MKQAFDRDRLNRVELAALDFLITGMEEGAFTAEEFAIPADADASVWGYVVDRIMAAFTNTGASIMDLEGGAKLVDEFITNLPANRAAANAAPNLSLEQLLDIRNRFADQPRRLAPADDDAAAAR